MATTLRHISWSILKLLGALAIGLVVAGLVIERSETTMATIERELHKGFSKAFDCVSSGRVTGINLVFPTIEMESVVVKPPRGSLAWHWSCRKAVITFSWMGVLMHRAAPLHIQLYDVRAHSVADDTGKPAIADHIKKLGAPVVNGLPLFCQELNLKNVVAHIHNPDAQVNADLQGHALMKKIKNHAHWNIYPHDGTLTWRDAPFIDHLSGTLHIDTAPQFLFTEGSLQGSLSFLHGLTDAQKLCFARGVWDKDHGTLTIHTADRALNIGPVTLANSQFAAQLTAPLAYLQKLIPGLQESLLVSGTCHVQASGDIRNLPGTLRGDITVRDCVLSGMRLPAAQFTVSADHSMALRSLLQATPQKQTQKKMTGILDLQFAPGLVMTGSWTWDPRRGTSVSVRNVSSISLPLEYWNIRPEDMQLNALIDKKHTVHAEYMGVISHEKLGTQHRIQGDMRHNGKLGALTGQCNDYRLAVESDHALSVRHATIHDTTNACVLDVMPTGTDQWTARIDYSLIRSLLPAHWQAECAGQGEVEVAARKDADGSWYADVQLRKGTVRIPIFNNFLNKLQGTVMISSARNAITLRDATLGFHRGEIRIPQAQWYLDASYRTRGLHVPLIITDVFASWRKDIGGAISGELLATQQPGGPVTLQGSIFADTAYMRSLDAVQQRASATYGAPASHEPVALNVRLMTRGPLTITSPQLDAKVQIDATVRKTSENPEVTGVAKIMEGTLKFPYKPMHIMSGSLTFVPGQEDPVVELVAKSKIRKYNVSLQVNGTVGQPNIVVDSSPPLTQEQIIALLLTGAEEGSLSAMMPTLVVQNLQQSLFGSQKSKSAFNNYFKSLLKPLSRVRLVPRFTEETGRGGLRGAIEIEVSDDLQATIEKNFSLTEDIKIKVDYSLSDEVSLRGIQDERGDLGSEMEVRWRF